MTRAAVALTTCIRGVLTKRIAVDRCRYVRPLALNDRDCGEQRRLRIRCLGEVCWGRKGTRGVVLTLRKYCGFKTPFQLMLKELANTPKFAPRSALPQNSAGGDPSAIDAPAMSAYCFAICSRRQDPMEPLITVIIPTRDRLAELARAIASVRAQNEPAWELLVVDDGNGSSVELVERICDPRIAAFPNAGCGLVDARNTAIVWAKGALIAWLDDDDWWDDPAHLSLVAAAGAEGDAVLFRGGWLVSGDGSRSVFDWDATADSLRSNNTVLTSSIAYPRVAHRRVGLLDRELGGYCDWDVLLRLVDAGYTLRRVGELAVCYSVKSASSSAQPATEERHARFELLKRRHRLTAEIGNHTTMDAALRARSANVLGGDRRHQPAPIFS
ncbi:MAG: glycosyltransferase [Methylocystis sp.]